EKERTVRNSPENQRSSATFRIAAFRAVHIVIGKGGGIDQNFRPLHHFISVCSGDYGRNRLNLHGDTARGFKTRFVANRIVEGCLLADFSGAC
ncbi:MAG: hypothetical protein KAQ71_03805, partial [Desulfobulbaceae bacterium]|nr:hypothetical protein [Desulfobulbaceae bacterium]